jgi:hypothetical protein
MKYAHWTTFEIRKLRSLHDNGHPTYAQLSEALPRHSISSSLNTARNLGLRGDDLRLRWLRLAHLHFAERDLRNGGVR